VTISFSKGTLLHAVSGHGQLLSCSYKLASSFVCFVLLLRTDWFNSNVTFFYTTARGCIDAIVHTFACLFRNVLGLFSRHWYGDSSTPVLHVTSRHHIANSMVEDIL